LIRVRVDDFPQTKGEPQHTLAAFREFHKCLRECIGGKRYILGVIPDRCSIVDILMLKNETDCVIGMHGTDHDEDRLDRNGGNQFEPYLTVGQIRTVLEANRMALSQALDRPVEVYMPPRNVIDERVARAAQGAGFEAFTTGPETSQMLRMDWHRWIIHSDPPLEYGRTDELLQHGAHAHLIKEAESKDVVLALHWTWETNIGLEHMKKFFAEIPAKHFQDFDS
jgi:hypothetical protein